MSIYYVSSSSGDDNNNGLTVSTPWETLEKINTYDLQPGDTVCFKCGDTWRGSVYTAPGDATNEVKYTSYGTGDKPLLLGSVAKNSGWTDLGDNIWQIESDDVLPTYSNLIEAGNWSFYYESPADASQTTDADFYYTGSSSFKIDCVEPGTLKDNIQFYNSAFEVVFGKTYKLTFAAKCTEPFALPAASLILPEDPWTAYAQVYPTEVNITTDWQEFNVYLTTYGENDTARLQISLGTDTATSTGLKANSSLYIDQQIDLRIFEIANPDHWQMASTDPAVVTKSIDSEHYYDNSDSVKLGVVHPGNESTSIFLVNGAYSMVPGRLYKVIFAVKSTVAFTIPIFIISKDEEPFTYYVTKSQIEVGTDWTEYTFFMLAEAHGSSMRFQFNLGADGTEGLKANSDFYIDRYFKVFEYTSSDFLGIDVGNIIFDDSDDVGIKKWSAEDLESQNDYYCDKDNGILKMYSESDPASLYSSIELARNINGVVGTMAYNTIEKLKIFYFAACGIRTNDVSHHANFLYNEIGWIGGGDLGDNERYGNGIQLWQGSYDILGRYNDIYQVYDAGISNQGMEECEQYNIWFLNNTINKCEMSIEIWLRPSSAYMYDVYYEYNNCSNAGRGWSHSQRPDPNGCHLLFYENTAQVDDVFVRYNSFDTATNELISGDDDNIKYYNVDYNTYIGTGNLYWAWGWDDSYSIEEYSQYIEAFNKDFHSTFNGYKYNKTKWTKVDNLLTNWTQQNNPNASWEKSSNSVTTWDKQNIETTEYKKSSNLSTEWR